MAGILGNIFDPLIGRGPSTAETSGGFQNLEGVGSAFSSFLLRRLRKDPSKTREFGFLREALRDQVEGFGAAARQRGSDRAISGGFLDSGQFGDQLAAIDRGEIAAFSGGIRDILIDLERRRTEGVLPFLAAGAQESLGVQGLESSNRLAERGQNFDFASDIFGALVPGGFAGNPIGGPNFGLPPELQGFTGIPNFSGG